MGGITVQTPMPTGAIHSDILADDTSTGFSLTLVFQIYPAFASGGHPFPITEKRHQPGIVFKKPDHQCIIDTAVVRNAIMFEMDGFSAGCNVQMPGTIQRLQALSQSCDLLHIEFMGIDMMVP